MFADAIMSNIQSFEKKFGEIPVTQTRKTPETCSSDNATPCRRDALWRRFIFA